MTPFLIGAVVGGVIVLILGAKGPERPMNAEEAEEEQRLIRNGGPDYL